MGLRRQGPVYFSKAPNSHIEIFQNEQTLTNGRSIVSVGNKSVTRTSVQFNPYLGLKGEGGKILSPAEALWHEVGHAYDLEKDPAGFDRRSANTYAPGTPDEHWNDEEEKYNITNNEHPLLRERDGLIRNEHDLSTTEIIRTKSSTSHEEDNLRSLPLIEH